jgi:single-strand DNA-binding protein
MNYQKIILAGNATVDAERRTSQKGDVSYTTFSVGVSGGKDQTTYFPVTVFGKHGEAVARYVTKGREVLVDGRIEVGENGRFNVIADRVRFGAPAQESKPAKKNTKKKK